MNISRFRSLPFEKTATNPSETRLYVKIIEALYKKIFFIPFPENFIYGIFPCAPDTEKRIYMHTVRIRRHPFPYVVRVG
jgi:hypothetical protein